MIEKRSGLLVEIATAPEERACITSSFVSIIPPAIIGIVVEMASLCIAFGITPGNTSISVGLEFSIILRPDVMDCESIKNIL